VTRQQDTLDARAAADEWAAEHGLPESGGYSGWWYQNSYLGGWWPEGWRKWWANYSAAPGSLIGGLVVAHQYTSTPVDTNLMLESEIVSQTPPPPGGDMPDIDEGWLAKKDAVVTAAGELLSVADQETAEANRKGGPRVTVTRRLADEVRARAEAILK
jgi:hypothetical protein